MVPDSGKTLRSSAYKPVNLPEPLQVSESASGEPVTVKVAHASPVAQASPPVKMSPAVAQASLPVKMPADLSFWRRAQPDEESGGEASPYSSLRGSGAFPKQSKIREVSSLRGSGAFPKQSGAVTSIDDRWRIDDEWWRSEPVSRFYYAVLFASGQRLVIYKDLISGKWYKQVY
jgi:hypothetical protein